MKKTVGVSVAVCVLVALIVGVIGFALGTRYTVAPNGEGIILNSTKFTPVCATNTTAIWTRKN